MGLRLSTGDYMSQMQEMLKRENVQIVEEVPDWREAVHVAVQPLVDGGYVKPCYIDGIIENAEKYGPYFVICPDLALLHARPEQGAISKQLAVTVLRKGVSFKEGADPVRVLVTLAAEGDDSHIEVMRVLATMFCDQENVTKVAEAPSADDVFSYFIDAAN